MKNVLGPPKHLKDFKRLGVFAHHILGNENGFKFAHFILCKSNKYQAIMKKYKFFY
jgi:hypothetical protein